MTASTIRSLQTVRYLSLQEDQSAAREEKQDALTKQKDQIGETFVARQDAIEEMKDARESMGLGTLIGTICCPLVGTLIGKGIGALAAKDDHQAMADANTDAGLSEVDRARAQDDFAKAQEDFDAVGSQQSQIEKFSRELRQSDEGLYTY
jgi:hypothetical protein